MKRRNPEPARTPALKDRTTNRRGFIAGAAGVAGLFALGAAAHVLAFQSYGLSVSSAVTAVPDLRYSYITGVSICISFSLFAIIVGPSPATHMEKIF